MINANSKKLIFRLSLLLLFLSLIVGCGNPTVNIVMKSTDDSNDMNAIQMRIMQLKSAEKFSLASRDALLRNAEETLGDDLIPNTKVEKIMIPGESFQLSDVELSEETRYVGITGDFFSPAKDGWSQLIDVSTGISEIKITVAKNFLSVDK